MEWLALELCTNIAHYLREDRPSLCALSSVSQTWRAPAQASLWETVQILHSGMGMGSALSIHRLPEVLQASPHLGDYVRKLCVFSNPEEVFMEPIVHMSSLLVILTHTKFLRTLAIERCKLSCSIPSDTGTRFHMPSQITLSLTVLDMHPAVLPVLFSRLSVATLSVLAVCVDRSVGYMAGPDMPEDLIPAMSPDDLRTVTAVHVLGLKRWDSDTQRFSNASIAEVLTACPRTLKMFSAICNLKAADQVEMLDQFLTEKGHCLEHLCLEYSGHDATPVRPAESPDLIQDVEGNDGFGGTQDAVHPTAMLSDCCPNLTTLEFTLAVAAESQYGNETHPSDAIVQWRCVLRVLSTAAPLSALSTLTVNLTLNVDPYRPHSQHPGSLTTLAFVDWPQWNTVLRGFRSLKEVRFRVAKADEDRHFRLYSAYVHGDGEMRRRHSIPQCLVAEMRELVVRGLPTVEERGILYCVDV